MGYESAVSLVATAFVVAAGCATYGMPVQHLADAEASIRSARDSYAAAPPAAQLHLKLAEEELAQARRAMSEGDNERADFVLTRAHADAELAVGEERQAQAEGDAQQARGALGHVEEPAGITKTTGATVPSPAMLPVPALPSAAPPPPSTTPETGGAR